MGSRFTWCRHFNDDHSIWERLDRGMVTNSWLTKFPGLRVHHLHCDSSNHSPLFLNLLSLDHPPLKNLFRFKMMWLSNNRSGKIVQVAWNFVCDQSGERDMLMKVEKCGKDLLWWNQNCFGNVRKELEKKMPLLIWAEREAMFSRKNFRVRELKLEINAHLDKEARMCSQHSRVLWLKNEDSKTKFFHSRATQRL